MLYFSYEIVTDNGTEIGITINGISLRECGVALMSTIKEIARLAGVSPATVSRVLNDKPDVNRQTRDAVLKVIEQMRYTPNANAKNLKTIATNVVCVIVKGIGNLFLLGIAESMQALVEKEGYFPYIHYIDENDDEVMAARQLAVEKKPLGFIFLGGSVYGRREDLKQLCVPAVFAAADAGGVNLKNVASVSVDDRQSARMAVDELLFRGHRDIAVLGGSLRAPDLVESRYQGVLDSFKNRGLTFSQERYFESKFSLDSAYRATMRILNSGLHLTALFCMSDIMAIGAAKAISDRGLKVPDDISVIGFDGIDFSRFYTPSLATVRQPVSEIAQTSVQIMARLIRGETGIGHVTVKSEILLGQSISTRYLSE